MRPACQTNESGRTYSLPICGLLVRIGYTLDRKRGLQLIYRHSWRRDLPMMNLQEGPAGKAKPYQVRQLVGLIDAHKLEVQ